VWKILAEPPLACAIAGGTEFFLQNLPLEIPRLERLGGRLQELGRAKRLNLLLLLLLGSLKEQGNLARELGKVTATTLIMSFRYRGLQKAQLF
jgi:hypothetical protein